MVGHFSLYTKMAILDILLEPVSDDDETLKRDFYEAMEVLSNRDRTELTEYIIDAYHIRLLLNKNKETKIYFKAYNTYDLWLQWDRFYDEYDAEFMRDIINNYEDENGDELNMGLLCDEIMDVFQTNDTLWFELYE